LTNDTQQPNKNKRSRTLPNATLIVRFFRLSRVRRTAHNGLVGGRKPGDFAKEYADHQVSAYKDAVSLFERHAKGGDELKFQSWPGYITI
jgi:predicted outer membrane protein